MVRGVLRLVVRVDTDTWVQTVIKSDAPGIQNRISAKNYSEISINFEGLFAKLPKHHFNLAWLPSSSSSIFPSSSSSPLLLLFSSSPKASSSPSHLATGGQAIRQRCTSLSHFPKNQLKNQPKFSHCRPSLSSPNLQLRRSLFLSSSKHTKQPPAKPFLFFLSSQIHSKLQFLNHTTQAINKTKASTAFSLMAATPTPSLLRCQIRPFLNTPAPSPLHRSSTPRTKAPPLLLGISKSSYFSEHSRRLLFSALLHSTRRPSAFSTSQPPGNSSTANLLALPLSFFTADPPASLLSSTAVRPSSSLGTPPVAISSPSPANHPSPSSTSPSASTIDAPAPADPASSTLLSRLRLPRLILSGLTAPLH